jgi:hypothetical protein
MRKRAGAEPAPEQRKRAGAEPAPEQRRCALRASSCAAAVLDGRPRLCCRWWGEQPPLSRVLWAGAALRVALLCLGEALDSVLPWAIRTVLLASGHGGDV